MLRVQLLIVLAILFLAEGFAYLTLDRKGIAFTFFLQPQGLVGRTQELFGIGYDEVDPLLGWGMSESEFMKQGFTVEHTMPVLVSDSSCSKDTFRILITGGSTSDLVFSNRNWPVELVHMLRDNGICAKIYVGAIGGYSSGQELLKLIRDGLRVMPDVHISYSGANEMFSPSFVSQYELMVFNRMMETRSTILLPNLIYLVRTELGMVSELKIHLSSPEEASTFWIDNMQIMHALAQQRGYRFIGILQPVLGVGKVDQPTELEKWGSAIEDYRTFYPIAIDSCVKYPYLMDLTAIFDTIDKPVYLDDCHLRPEMQALVAKEISSLITN